MWKSAYLQLFPYTPTGGHIASSLFLYDLSMSGVFVIFHWLFFSVRYAHKLFRSSFRLKLRAKEKLSNSILKSNLTYYRKEGVIQSLARMHIRPCDLDTALLYASLKYF